jgi:transcriptional regulator with XRE-family HTH domain
MPPYTENFDDFILTRAKNKSNKVIALNYIISFICFPLRYSRREAMLMKNNLTHVGANIRAARKRKNLTLEVVSGLADVSESFLGMVERGASSVSIETLIALCEALDVTADSLIMEGREITSRPSDKRDTLHTMLKNATDEEVEFYINFVKLCRGSSNFNH